MIAVADLPFFVRRAKEKTCLGRFVWAGHHRTEFNDMNLATVFCDFGGQLAVQHLYAAG